MSDNYPKPELTEADILAMPPGRTLDAMIAERVFGWKWCASVNGDPALVEPNTGQEIHRCYWPNRQQEYPTPEMRDFHCRTFSAPCYSQNPTDAWDVVGALERLGYWMQARTIFSPEPWKDEEPDGCFAGFTPHNTTGWNGVPDNWSKGQSVPHAICLAALVTLLWRDKAADDPA